MQPETKGRKYNYEKVVSICSIAVLFNWWAAKLFKVGRKAFQNEFHTVVKKIDSNLVK